MAGSARGKVEITDAEEAVLADGGLEDLLGFHLRMAHFSMYQDFAATVGKLDLTQKQAAILMLIAANPGLSQVSIAAYLGADRATVMAMVDKLAARALIIRVKSETDRRKQELHLTPLGQRTLVKVRAQIAEHEKRFTSRFSARELEALFDALRKIEKGA